MGNSSSNTGNISNNSSSNTINSSSSAGNNEFMCLGMALHGAEIFEEKLYVEIEGNSYKLISQNLSNKGPTYTIQLEDGSQRTIPIKQGNTTYRKFQTVEPKLVKIPEQITELYKFNLTDLGTCNEFTTEEIIYFNNIILQCYLTYKDDIHSFLLQVNNDLNIALNEIYNTTNINYITAMNCLDNNPERQIVDKYLSVKGDEEPITDRNSKKQDNGIFPISISDLREDIDYLELTFNTENGKIQEPDLFNTVFKGIYKDITLRQLLNTLALQNIRRVVLFDYSCFPYVTHKLTDNYVRGVYHTPVLEGERNQYKQLLIDKEGNIIHPYGGKRKGKTKGKTKNRRQKAKKIYLIPSI